MGDAQAIEEIVTAVREAQNAITAAIGGLAKQLPPGIVIAGCDVDVTELQVLGGGTVYMFGCRIRTELRAK